MSIHIIWFLCSCSIKWNFVQILTRLSLVLGSKFVTDPISDIVWSGWGPCFQDLNFVVVDFAVNIKEIFAHLSRLIYFNVSDSSHGYFMGRTLFPCLAKLCHRLDFVLRFHPWCCVIWTLGWHSCELLLRLSLDFEIWLRKKCRTYYMLCHL